MTPRVLLHLLLAISMLVGGVLGSAASPLRGPLPTSSAAATGMPADMDCCPKTAMARDCSKCPFMALCSQILAEQRTQVYAATMTVRVDRRTRPSDEPDLVGSDALPLPEPPRSSV